MAPDSLKQELQSLLQDGRPDIALNKLEPALRKYPGDPDLWLIAGLLHGQSGEPAVAERAFRRATELSPRAFTAWNNLGRAQMLQGKPDEAAASFEKAIELGPTNPLPYLGYGALLREKGEYAASEQVLRTALAKTARVPDLHVQLGATLYMAGNPDAAMSEYNRALEIDPQCQDALINLAVALRATGKPDQALSYLQRYLQLRQDALPAWYELASTYLDLNHWQEALRCYRRILDIAPGSYMAHVCMASILIGQDEIDQARQSLDSALAKCGADNPDVCAQYAELHLLAGDKAAARKVLKPALDRYPENLNVALVGAQLARSADEVDAALEVLERLEQQLTNPPHNLYYLKTRLYERAGRYDEAFLAAQSAHSRRNMVSDLERHLDEMQRIEQFFTPERLVQLSGASHADPAPVFIVGMPRSGTTLAEQILSSHPDVHGAGETTRLWQLIRDSEQATDQMYPQSLEALGIDNLHAAAAGYLQDLHALAPGAQRICDKLPHNFLHLGLIQVLFPNARVIYCRRDALDNCLSIFMHRLNINHRYAQNLADLGVYYRRHAELMDYWLKTLDLKIHRLDYERLVEDQEGESRRLLATAGLEWDEACLRFHENRRSVVTPSYDQVRQPLYRSSMRRWQRYEAHLQPLIDVLQD